MGASVPLKQRCQAVQYEPHEWNSTKFRSLASVRGNLVANGESKSFEVVAIRDISGRQRNRLPRHSGRSLLDTEGICEPPGANSQLVTAPTRDSLYGPGTNSK